MSEQREHLMEVMKDFSRGMLTSRCADGSLHTRPMVVAELDEDGTAWLMSDDRSEKVHELEKDCHASLSVQSNTQYACLSGPMKVKRDKQKIKQLFKEPWKTYFPKGADDPHLVLLQLKAERGEYWDNAGTSGIKYAWQAAKAYAKGEKPVHDESIHSGVRLNDN